MINLLVKGTGLHNIDLIIFDKDGTLFEMYPYWSAIARNRAARICDALDIEDSSLLLHIMGTMGVDVFRRRMSPGGPIGVLGRDRVIKTVVAELQRMKHTITEDRVGDIFRETDAWLEKGEVSRDVFVPVRGLLDFLNLVKPGCKCAILSYDQTKNLTHTLQVTGMAHYFDEVMGGDLIKIPKPSPWGAEMIMKACGVPPENTIYIGDSMQDIACGKNAGCAYTIVRKSEITTDAAREISDFIISDYTEILYMGRQ